jgi:hypothetical protein
MEGGHMSFLNKAGLMGIVQGLFDSSDIGFVGPASVVWRKDKRAMTSPKDAAICTLELIHREAYGQDDYQWNFDAVTNAMTLVSFGNRGFTIQIRLDMYRAEAEAQDVLDSIAALLWLPTTSDKFQAINHAMSTSREAYDVTDSTVDNRIISSAVMEIHLLGVSSAVQVQPAGTGWIETWNGNDIPILNGESSGASTIPALRCRANPGGDVGHSTLPHTVCRAISS